MDVIETLYAWMIGTAPARALAAGVIAMLLVQALKPWLAEQHYKPVAGIVALVLSVLMMCAGSLIIAVTPGYASIGVAAPALLVLASVFAHLVSKRFGAPILLVFLLLLLLLFQMH